MQYANRGCVFSILKGITTTAVTIASLIAIYIFISGHSSLFSSRSTTNASPAPTVILSADTTTPSTDVISANGIPYVLSTWGCWIGIGLLVGIFAGGRSGYKSGDNDIGGFAAGCALGSFSGVFIALLVGWLSSVIINYLNIQYAFLWNMGITAIIVYGISGFIGHVIGSET